MRVIYVHHANRQKGNPPSQKDGLTEVGIKDCEVTRELLNEANKQYKICKIYTSEYYRCTKTCELINKDIKAPVVVDARLNEKGKEENWVDTQIRLHEILDEIVENHKEDDTVVCVTSGINLGAFVAKSLKLKPARNFPMYGVPSCSPIMFEYKKGC